jgi:hypothetical protein
MKLKNAARLYFKTTATTAATTVVPVRRRIRAVGIHAEAEQRKRDCLNKSFGLNGSFENYGSDGGGWRDYINQSPPLGVQLPHRRSLRVQKRLQHPQIATSGMNI